VSLELPAGFVEAVRDRLSTGQRLRRTLPGGGRLHVDRQLPFLVVYRRPVDRPDPGTARLITGQASYLAASADPEFAEPLSEIVQGVVETLSNVFGAFLIVELWTVSEPAAEARDSMVRVVTPDQQGELETANELSAVLEELDVGYWRPQVRLVAAKTATPSGLPPLLAADEANRLKCYVIGIELEPMFRDEGGSTYPELVRELTSQLSAALQRAFFAFSEEKTSADPRAWQGLGRRALVRAVRKVDGALGDICGAYDFLLCVTPVDCAEAWRKFEETRFEEDPSFRYRPLTAEPELLLRDLYAVPLEDVEDPTLDRLFREKMREVARQLTMLAERNTHRFLYGSFQLYGVVEPDLLRLADGLLTAIEPKGTRGDEDGVVDAVDFARLAAGEFERYREQVPQFDAEIDVRDDISGLMVSSGTLLIDRTMTATPRRARALLHHEVGTHVLTWFNGGRQPLQIFRTGLAGHEVAQEGLAVLSEYLVGGLTRARLRLLAARVVAVDRMIGGASFVEIFRELVDRCGLGPHLAFTTTMRVVRAGGLTKDAVYLRGLQQVVGYLREGGDPALAFIGKVALRDMPVVRELLHRGVLTEPALRPAALDAPGASDRLAALRDGKPIVELFERSS
jgi:uncharacterized protein (TIGR02421 family)